MQGKSVRGWLTRGVTSVPLSVAHHDAESMYISQDLTVPGVAFLPYTGQAVTEVPFVSECYVLKGTPPGGCDHNGRIPNIRYCKNICKVGADG